MKFSHQLKFNSVPEWRDHYVQYGHLKKLIYALAKKEAEGGEVADVEGGLSQPLIPQDVVTEEMFIRELDAQLAEIVRFFEEKEAEFASKLRALQIELSTLERIPSSPLLPSRAASSQALNLLLQGSAAAPPSSAHLASFQLPQGGSTHSGGSHSASSSVQQSPRRSPRVSSSQLGVIGGGGGGGGGGEKEKVEKVGGSSMSDSEDNQTQTTHSATLSSALPTTTPPITALPPLSADQQIIRLARVEFWKKPRRRLFQSSLSSEKARLMTKFQDIYIGLHDLAEYVTMNREGLRKTIKKHDKLTQSCNLKAAWLGKVDEYFPLSKRTELEELIAGLIDNYAILYFGGDVVKAEAQLAQGLRDYITVERNTVWRDIAAMERKYSSVAVKHSDEKKPGVKSFWSYHHRSLKLGFCIAVFLALLNRPVFPEQAKSNCLALLVFASMLWALEAIPLFVTSMLVPPLIVILRLLVDRSASPPHRLSPEQAAPRIFSTMFSQTIMLLLGGFSIAAALSKHAIAKQMSLAVLTRVGRRPRNVLLASMFVATFASMWITNVAAPVLCFSLVQPILRTLDHRHPLAKALVLGIALASNVGGMTSPISSPQNIFAIERMSMDGSPPSWLNWFAVSIPLAIICNLCCWGILLLVYRPEKAIQEIRPMKPMTDPINGTQVFIIFVSVITVALWCCDSFLEPILGDMGVVAMVPMVAFFGSEVLKKDDFNSFLWNVVMLAMGGSALGEAVSSSGLLSEIAAGIQDLVVGYDLFAVCAIFCALILVAATFISHTVAAMVVLPIVQKVGEQMPGSPHPKALVMAAALMCSGAMGLPVSGFPNMNAVSLEDVAGETFINSFDFIKAGVPTSIVAYGLIVTVGYCIMLFVGF